MLGSLPHANHHFFREHLRECMPDADPDFLASLEREGVPTIHNMILGDPIVSKIGYEDAARFATFIARRLFQIYSEAKPSVVIGTFDCLHSGLGLAVARNMGIPWYATNFSVIPAGLVSLCDRMSPNSRVLMVERPKGELHGLAEDSLRRFENRHIQAAAYIAPTPAGLLKSFSQLPRKSAALARTLRDARLRQYLQFTEGRNLYDARSALSFLYRASRARKAVTEFRTLKCPPKKPYVLFGLHLQPESSIDVWAPFFSNQLWVIELLSRAIPPTHALLVRFTRAT